MTKTKFTPIDNNIIIREIPTENIYNGVLIPTDSESIKEGEVIAIGPGQIDYYTPRTNKDEVIRIPMTIKVGDRVVYNNLVGAKLKYNGMEYILQRQSDILTLIDHNEE